MNSFDNSKFVHLTAILNDAVIVLLFKLKNEAFK